MIISNILFALYGGALYRWRGHASKYKKYFPRPFNQIAFAAPYAALCYPVIGWWCLGILVVTTLSVLTGHGKWMDLGTWDEKASDETIEFPIKFLESKLSSYWYDVVGMSWSGLVITIPAAIVTISPLLAVSGSLKGVAYMIGRKFFDEDVATDRGEFLTGFFLYLCLAFYLF